MNQSRWIEDIVSPAVRRTQDEAQYWPVLGVGLFAAVLELPGHLHVVGGQDVATACARLRECGARPVAAVDYIQARSYGNEAMRTAFTQVVEGCLEEQVALVGGESAEHNNDPEGFALTWVVVVGVGDD